MLQALLLILALLTLAALAAAAWLWRARESLAHSLTADLASARAALAHAQAAHAALAAQRDREADIARALEADLRDRLDEARLEATRLAERHAALEREMTDARAWIQSQRAELKAAFVELSAGTLDAAGQRLLLLAEQRFSQQKSEAAADLDRRRAALDELIKPIGEALKNTQATLGDIESKRLEHAARLEEQLRAAAGATADLRSETGRLTNALSRPEVRGRYGEIQLRRVAELAGMTPYCDFDEQASATSDTGEPIRPDMVIRLPNERVIVVDAKANTYAYVEAVNARSDDERRRHLERFADHIADQVKKLSDKRYWTGWQGSPQFTVMFVPGDHFIDAALARKPELLERAAERGIILASPSTLIGLLRAVAVGWQEKRVADDAATLQKLGQELHERAAIAFEHIHKLGRLIASVTEQYNSAVGSIDARLLPTLRRFEDSGVRSSRQLPELSAVEITPKPLAPTATQPRD